MIETRLRILQKDGTRVELAATGAWTADQAQPLDAAITDIIKEFPAHAPVAVAIDAAGISQLDTYGAWLLERLTRQAAAHGASAHIANLEDRFAGLYAAIRKVPEPAAQASRAWTPKMVLETTGRTLAEAGQDARAMVDMLGAVAQALVGALSHPRSLRVTPTVHQFDRVAWQAVPIIVLMTFLIGGIIAQQGFFHFRKFGADQYVVDMVGVLVLREIGVLLVAIMVAGRSGSSYTAELGSMKMREEIDALRTIGLDPVAVLILPRLIALVVALPALALLGALAALYGGGVVAWLYGDMNPSIFIERLRDAVTITHLKVGLIKAPFMALVIGIVACTEGLKVGGSAESLGLRTTASVVKSIFLVIVLDGFFAIYFSAIGM